MDESLPGLREVAVAGFKAALATNVAGRERALFDAIVAAGYDIVFLPDTPPTSLGKLARMGIPLTHASMFQGVQVPQEIAASVMSGGLWVAEPMLTRSLVSVRLDVYSVNAGDVERYAEVSGDTNRLHFDEAYARSLGFDGRISHGMIFNGWVSRYLGTTYPGEGTIFLRNASSYFAPVYPGRAYSVRISVPMMDTERGVFKVLFQLREGVTEHGSKLAMLSYNDVMQRHTGL